MKWIVSVVLVSTVLMLGSCSTDLDLTAEWKDITVVYGLLDQDLDTQFVRVNRAFLGQEDAGQMAQVPDSLKYKDASVKIDEYDVNGTMTRSFDFIKITNYPKDTGYFASQGHEVYAYVRKTGEAKLNTARSYKLTVTNNETGKEVTAETNLCEGVSVTKPNSNQLQYALANAQLEPYESQNNYIGWTTGSNTRRYQVYIKYRWINVVFSGTDTLDVNDSLTIYLGEERGTRLSGGEGLKLNWGTEKFFEKVEAYIKKDNNYNANVYYRKSGTFDIIIQIAGDELDTYMEVNEPSTGIIQERPEYTNLVTEDNSAVGVFSSRYTQVRTITGITANSIKKLQTLDLLFCDPSPSVTNVVPCP